MDNDSSYKSLLPVWPKEVFIETVQVLRANLYALLYFSQKEIYLTVVQRQHLAAEVFLTGCFITGEWFSETHLVTNQATLRQQCTNIEERLRELIQGTVSLRESPFVFYGVHDAEFLETTLDTEWIKRGPL